MSWNLIKNSDRRKAKETVFLRPRSGGDLRVALGYPNTYEVGMSNLGMQVVYSLFNSIPGVVCERFFLPDPEELIEYRQCGRHLFTMESQRPIDDFDVVAFSIAFEPDFVNMVTILDLAGIPILAKDRAHGDYPLILVGGAITLLNPEPIADIVDLFCLGESEEFLPQFVEIFLQHSQNKQHLLRALASLPGAYIPSFWQDLYNDDGFFRECIPREGCPENKPIRLHLSSQSYAQNCARSQFLTEDTELGRSGLVEISRGCAFNCRFCTVGFSYPKIRWKPLDKIWQAIESFSPHTDKVGLISATAGTYPHINELCQLLIDHHISVAFSSLRVNNLPDLMLEALVRGGAKTITLAPEVGSDQLRRVANKCFTDVDYLHTAGRAFESGIVNVRMYSMVGLPGEREEHLQALIDLVNDTRKLQVKCGRGAGHVTLSTGQLIPKPFTPFQWCSVLEKSKVSRSLKILERGLAKIGGAKFSGESPKWAAIQALLARGDRRIAKVLAEVFRGANPAQWLKVCQKYGIDVDRELYEERDVESTAFPWYHLLPEATLKKIRTDWGLAQGTINKLIHD